MRNETIIKDSRGKLRIVTKLVTFEFSAGGDKPFFRYDVMCWCTAPNKRKEVYIENILTEKEIAAAKMQLWQKIKP